MFEKWFKTPIGSYGAEADEPVRNPFRELLSALPAFLCGIALVVAMLVVGTSSEGEILLLYREQAAEAMKANRLAEAQLYYERLVRFYGPSYPEYSYKLATTDLSLNNRERGVFIMRSLADSSRQGYPAAHTWHAGMMLASNNNLSEAQFREAELHLLRALQAEPDSIEAHAILARLYVARGLYRQALPHLQEVVGTYEDLRVELARCYRVVGDKARAAEEAAHAARYQSNQVARNLDDNAARLRWADALQLQNDFNAAASVLAEGLRLTSDRVYRSALAQLYAVQAKQVEAEDPWSAERFFLLEKALELDAGNVLAVQQLYRLAREGNSTSAARKMQGLLSTGAAPAALHLLLGYDALRNQQHEQARIHFEQAYAQEPQMAMAANNLAVALTQQRTPDLARALQLVNSALTQFPNQPNFLETRGQLHVKMQQWDKAISDLEAALPKLANKQAVHGSLALAYDSLGLAEMAAQHRLRATEPINVNPRKIDPE